MAFIKPFETPQKNVEKKKILVNFIFIQLPKMHGAETASELQNYF